MTNRRYEFDWLRVLATLVVFVYHSSRFFSQSDWIVKNVKTYTWVENWNIFAMSWLMPLFFVISGVSLFYAIGKSATWKKFYIDKFQRLIVPVVIATFTHCALQVYLERVTHGQFSGSFFSFIPAYFNGLYQGIGMQGGNFNFMGMHLWYLLFLFLDSLICYHLFLRFKGSGSVILHRITLFIGKPGWMYFWFSIPLLIMKVLIPPAILNFGAGSWGFLYYLWFLISGFMIAANDQFQINIRNQRWVSLTLGLVLSVVYFSKFYNPLSAVFPSWLGNWVFTTIYFFNAWCWLFTILGFSMQYLAFDRPFLRYTNEGVLPFYILHQTILLSIGYFVMTWEIDDVLKWAIVLLSSFIVIITTQTLIIRRFDLFRFMFGMKTSRPIFNVFRKREGLIILHALYLGLIAFAISGVSINRSPAPLVYDPVQDILLDSRSITKRSSTGISIIKDNKASNGQAIRFSSGANQQVVSHPTVYLEISFSAPAGFYTLWIRGKSERNDMTDSIWLQVDDYIGTRMGNFNLGNWLDIYPAGIYAWASDGNTPTTIELKHTGNHLIRLQPRQTPHCIDQIWLSKYQSRIPNTYLPIKN